MNGQYRTIVADPPWVYKGSTPVLRGPGGCTPRRAPMPYPMMSVAAIAALPVAGLAARDAHLYLWTTNRYLESAFTIARAWGFVPSTTLVWCKKPLGRGVGLPAYPIFTEYVLFCRRGTLPATERAPKNWFEWKRGKPSQKPEAFQDLVEQVSPGPYLELFARRQRLGWSVWGNEVDSKIMLGVAD